MTDTKYVFKIADSSFLDEAVLLASAEYAAEQKLVNALYAQDDTTEIRQGLEVLLHQGKIITAYKSGTLAGFLGVFYSRPNLADKYDSAWGPIGGYGIGKGPDRSKLASLLFQHLSEELLPFKVRDYTINLYAHDTGVLKSFVLNQFGIICTYAVRDLAGDIPEEKLEGITFREFSREDITKCQEPLLQHWRSLANHLQKSPSYYYGQEFTDISYISHLHEKETRLFTALDSVGNIIGVVDTNRSGFFPTADDKTLNIADLHIDPVYRGKGVAQGLLNFTCESVKKDGIKRLWVMHGTVNPNALGFWSKYFTPYIYQVTRSIDSRIVDLCSWSPLKR
jgi:GNAT superfamily N-acetyltransferase